MIRFTTAWEENFKSVVSSSELAFEVHGRIPRLTPTGLIMMIMQTMELLEFGLRYGGDTRMHNIARERIIVVDSGKIILEKMLKSLDSRGVERIIC